MWNSNSKSNPIKHNQTRPNFHDPIPIYTTISNPIQFPRTQTINSKQNHATVSKKFNKIISQPKTTRSQPKFNEPKHHNPIQAQSTHLLEMELWFKFYLNSVTSFRRKKMQFRRRRRKKKTPQDHRFPANARRSINWNSIHEKHFSIPSLSLSTFPLSLKILFILFFFSKTPYKKNSGLNPLNYLY